MRALCQLVLPDLLPPSRPKLLPVRPTGRRYRVAGHRSKMRDRRRQHSALARSGRWSSSPSSRDLRETINASCSWVRRRHMSSGLWTRFGETRPGDRVLPTPRRGSGISLKTAATARLEPRGCKASTRRSRVHGPCGKAGLARDDRLYNPDNRILASRGHVLGGLGEELCAEPAANLADAEGGCRSQVAAAIDDHQCANRRPR